MSGVAPPPLHMWGGAPGARYRIGGPPSAAGWMGAPGARYRVGGAPVVPAAPRPEVGPVPPGYYDPTRDINIAEGKNTYSQARSKGEREEGYAESDFGINQAKLGYQSQTGLEDIGTERTRQNEAATRALAQLAESYKRLGVRQQEGANRAGVLQGGALLQAAAKRAANEGKGRDETNLTLKHQLEADDLREARLKHGIEEGEGSNVRNTQRLLSGFGEGITNAETNEQHYGEGIETLKNYEAAHNGYTPLAYLLNKAPAKAPARRGRGGRR